MEDVAIVNDRGPEDDEVTQDRFHQDQDLEIVIEEDEEALDEADLEIVIVAGEVEDEEIEVHQADPILDPKGNHEKKFPNFHRRSRDDRKSDRSEKASVSASRGTRRASKRASKSRSR